MILRFTFLLPLLLCLAAADTPLQESKAAPDVELSELRENRSLWLGEEVRFVFQLGGELKTWEPWVTPFGAEDYRAFSAWGDSALLWEAADYADLTSRLFVRRGSLVSKLMSKVRRYDRFEVRAVVRTIFLDEPWIELLEVRRLNERVSQGTVLHAERALKLIENEHFELALGELERARQGRLPAHIGQKLVELHEQCQEGLEAK